MSDPFAGTIAWVSDPAGARERIGPAWSGWTGADPSGEAGDGWQRRMHPDDLPGYLQRTAGGCTESYRLRHADGTERAVVEHAVATFVNDHMTELTGRGLPGLPALLTYVTAADRHAAAALPLLSGGVVVGAVGISFATPRTFPADERAFVLAMAGKAALALERATAADERRVIAETLQSSLLPPTLPELEQLSLAARYLPGAQGTRAGGDWYDVIPLGYGRVAIAVGDVVGQGTRAAAVMGQLRSALSAYLLEGRDPVRALDRLDRFAHRVPGAAGSTVTCMVLDVANGELTWARAGHPPPLVLGPVERGRSGERPAGHRLSVRRRDHAARRRGRRGPHSPAAGAAHRAAGRRGGAGTDPRRRRPAVRSGRVPALSRGPVSRTARAARR